MSAIRNLSEVLSARQGSKAGITFCEAGQEQFLSYGDLQVRAESVLTELQNKGWSPRQYVVLQTEDNERFIVLFWACVLGGLIPVPITAGRTDEQRRKLLQVWAQLGEPCLLCEPDLWNSITAFCGKNGEEAVMRHMESRMLSIPELMEASRQSLGSSRPVLLHQADKDDVAFIQFTSGSTGDPKGVVLTHGNLLANMRAIVAGAKSSEADSSLSWLPLTHDMGLIGFHLTPMLAGMNQWQMPTSMFVLHPMTWLELTNRHRITCLSSPNFGYIHFLQHFKPEQAAEWDLSPVRLIFNGAEPISASHCRLFTERMKPYGLREESLFPVYGLAEASLAVTFPNGEERLNTLRVNRRGLNIGDEVQAADAADPEGIEIVELGYPVADCQVDIRSAAGESLAEGCIGLIHIKGSNVTKGYFNRPDVNKATIKQGWLNTGDLGLMRDGRLYVTGRLKDVIFVNGQNVYPHDLETLVSEIPGAEIGKAAVTAVQDEISKQDEIAVFLQYRGKLNAFLTLRDSVKRLLNRRAGLNVTLIVPVKRIPKTTSGKIQRYSLAQSLKDGEYSAVIAELQTLLDMADGATSMADKQDASPETEMEIRTLRIWRQVLKTDTLGIDDSFLEHGGNSLRAAYVAARLQEEFGLDITLGELFRHDTVRTLAAYLTEQARLTGRGMRPEADWTRSELNAGSELKTGSEPKIGSELNAGSEPNTNSESRNEYPASSAQKRLYILEQMNPGLLSYHLPQSIQIEGVLDHRRFEQAWRLLMKQHAALRTSFVMEEDRVMQRISPDLAPPIEEVDGQDWSENDIQDRLKSFVQPYELDHAPLFRMELIRLAPERHLLLFDIHHLLTDGTSMGILMGDFVALYEEHILPPLKLDYGEISTWQQSPLQQERIAGQLSYWQQLYADGVPSASFPADFPRPLVPGYRGATERIVLDDELTASLRELASRTGTTMYTVLLSVYYVLLSRYSGADDVVIGTAAARRTRPESHGIVGLFINMLPLRLRGGTDLSMADWLKKAGGQIMACLDHQDAPYEDILERIQASREYGRNPLFDTVFTLQNMELPELRTQEALFRPSVIDTGTAKFDLTWECSFVGKGIEISIEFACDLFRADTVRQLGRHYVQLAREAVRRPDAAVRELAMLDAEEKRERIELGHAMRSPYPGEVPLHRLFERQAALVPQHPAVVKQGRVLSYEELNKQANALARLLIRRGVMPHSRVALVVARSCEMPVAILAVLKTGSAYVPVDPQYPADRIRFMLQDAGVSMLIADASSAGMCRELAALLESPLEVIDLSGIRDLLSEEDGQNLSAQVSADEPAYIMYTSGSTGKPKGIVTTHRNISRVVTDTDYIRITHEDVLLQLSNYAFDGSTFDLYGALLNGAKLVLAGEDEVLDVYKLTQLISNYQVSVFFTTTALFNTLVDYGLESLTSVRHILFGGERASASHVRKALTVLGPGVLLHMYGPTETTVFATCYPIIELAPEQAVIPIGRPIAHSEAYVLDASGQLVPALVPGELCLAGDGVARGYLNLPDMTASKFVPHPYREGQWLYKTGDLVRWLADGNLEFLDRMDSQVKLRGFRIELGEIESKLLECAGVKEAVVVLKQREGSGPLLCAYIVREGAESAAELRGELAQRLPAFMLPAAIVCLDRLPLTTNGKIDKIALPEPDAASLGFGRSGMFVAPATPTEMKLVRIWQEVLKVDAEIGAADHFFEHGGHSLKAATLVSEIYKQCHIRMPIKEVFLRPTVRDQAAWLDQAATDAYEPIAPAHGEACPLSPAQQRIFLLEQLEDVGIAYHIPLALRLNKPIARQEMERAIRELIARNEPLRTTFRFVGGEVRQIVHERADFELAEVQVEESKLDERFGQFVKPMTLSEAPLLHACLVHCKSGDDYLFLNLHHIIADGISIKLLLDQLMQLLEGKTLERPTVQYKDYTVWEQRQQGMKQRLESQSYWQAQLANSLPVLDMPLDYPRGDRRTFEGETLSFDLPSGLSARLQELALRQEISLNSLLFSAYALLLHRYSNQRDLVIGTLTAGRTHPDTLGMVGMFNQFLPVRVAVGQGASFDEVARETHHRLLEVYEHEELSFDKLIEAACLPYDPSRNPLFDTMLIVHNQFEADLEVKGDTRTMIPVRLGSNSTAKLDFKLDVYTHSGNRLSGELEFNSQLYRRDTMERLAERWVQVLEQVAERPGEDCSSVQIMTAGEEQRILADWNGTEAPYPANLTIHAWFEAQADRTPGRIAVRAREGTLTYRQLDEQANRLARILMEKGIKADSIVPIAAERSLALMVGIMAILKAGGAYLPVNPHYPPERLHYILKDSRAAVLCAQAKWAGNLRSLPFDGDILDLDAWLLPNAEHSGDRLPPISGPGNLAYVIYTSGSTGQPKGVMIEHQAVINRLHWMQKAYPLVEQDVILQKTPITFDVSVWELFWWSSVGASVYLLEPEGEKEPAALLRVMKEQGVTVMHFVPSMLGVFLPYAAEAGWDRPLSGLRYVFTSGEALKPAYIRQFYRLCGEEEASTTRLINLYGPTEATVDVSAYDCADYTRGPVPIGRPIDNIRLYVTDEQGGLQPIGIPGELCIAGVGLARGYLNREDLTAEKFVQNPVNPGERLYRTGDRARWLPDGNLEYLGRFDHQVKLRGLRIECGEIEHALLNFGMITDAIVLMVKDHAGEEMLAAYLVSAQKLDERELKAALRQTLPDYMVPSLFVHLEAFPLTSSGKVDRSRLPQPMYADSGSGAEPRNENERLLAELWMNVLGVPQIRTQDHFFLLGGHSLRAAQLAGAVEQRMKVAFSLKDVFAAPVFEDMADLIMRAPKQAASVITRVEERPYYPMSLAQNRLFVLHQMNPSHTAYNLPLALKMTGELDVGRLQQALGELTIRHEPLRTSFGWAEGVPVQRIHEQVMLQAEVVQTSSSNLAELFNQSYQINQSNQFNQSEASGLLEGFIRPFDLQEAPLIRATLLTDGGMSHMLLLDMHHIIADGISMSVLAKDFAKLYQIGMNSIIANSYRGTALSKSRPGADFATGPESATGPDSTTVADSATGANLDLLQPLKVQYKDAAVWQQNWMAGEERQHQEAYWRKKLGGTLPLLNLPADRLRPAELSFDGSRYTTALPAGLVEQVKRLADTEGMTPYHVLLACYHVLLYRLSGQQDLIVGTPIGGRFHPETEHLVGMFVNTVAIRSQPAGEMTFQQFAGQVKEEVLAALHHGMLPFEHVVSATDVPRDLSRNPIFDVMFVLQHMESSSLELGSLLLEPVRLEHPVSKADLTFELAERANGMDLTVEYATALFDHASIRRMVSYYLRILETVTWSREVRLQEISLMTEQEEAEQLATFNATGVDYPAEKTIEGYLEDQAEQTPESIAVCSDAGQLTYRELNERSNRLARMLRKRGAGADSAVAVLMDRSLDMMIAIFGILKAGAAYVPISPQLPAERIRYMLSDSEASLVLIDGRAPMELGEVEKAEFISVEHALQEEWEDTNLPKLHHSRNLAYVLYTSGSTGKPKGVMIEHHSVINRLMWMQRAYPLDQQAVILQKTPITFDVSVWELFWWSFTGAKLCLLKPGGEKDPAAILDAIAEHGVTTLHFVPSMLHLFLDYPGISPGSGAKINTLRTVFASGEALMADHVLRFKRTLRHTTGAKLINLYGPTEATVDVSFYDCTPFDETQTSVPIGRPIDNTSLYIMNEGMRLEPPGIAGELCIAGAGLARGYLNRPELTAEKFVPNPYDPGEVLYRTGDLARWLPDGQIEYLGRIDHQVKIRGYRIELGEIEHALTGHPAVKEAVVMKRGASDPAEAAAGSAVNSLSAGATSAITTGASAEAADYLCAYIVAAEPVTGQQLRTYLGQFLPDYMVPVVYVELPAIPLSLNGKADRRALPAPDRTLDTSVRYVAAAGEIETSIAGIWQDVLNRSDIGVHHNFFDVGGESLLLLRAHQRLDELYPGVLKVTDLFNYPTIAKLAEYLESKMEADRFWMLESLPVQRDCANEVYTSQVKGAFRLILDSELSAGLAELAEIQGFSVDTAALAIYALFWKQKSGLEQVELPVAVSGRQVTPLRIDFSVVRDFDELLHQADVPLRTPVTVYDWQQVKKDRADRDEFAITPLYVAGGSPQGFSITQEMLHLFDIVLTVEPSSRGSAKKDIQALWEFNARRLKTEKIKEWAQGYVKLLRMAVRQHREASQSSVSAK